MAENPVCWWELASHDADKTVAFLKQVFDWDLKFDDRLGFYVMPSGEQDRAAFGGGGVFTLRKARLPFITIYIQVADIEAKARAVEAAGGFIVEGPISIGKSRICLFNEPSGVTLAMLEARARG